MARDMTAGGYAVTKSFEGLSLKSYRDAVGVWTIGFGNTNYDEFAVSYLGQKIGPGMVITAAQADYLLHESMKRKYLPQCEKKLPGVSDGAFDASGSFHYNTGAIGKASWVAKLLGGQDYHAALMSWNKAGGKVLAGLTRRRNREYEMAHDGNYGPEGHARPLTIATDASGKETGVVKDLPADHPEHPLAGTPGMLRKGDEFPEVKDLQEHLLVPLGFNVPVTGKFDDATDKAVRAFQKAHPQLGSDGVVGPATRTSMQRELDMKSKLVGSTASTGSISVASVVADQASGGGMPGWLYIALAVLVVGTALHYGWKYRDEVRAYFARFATDSKPVPATPATPDVPAPVQAAPLAPVEAAPAVPPGATAPAAAPATPQEAPHA